MTNFDTLLNEKKNGKMTRGQILMGTYNRALSHIALKDTKSDYAMIGLERRTGLKGNDLINCMKYLANNEKFAFHMKGRTVIFEYYIGSKVA